MWHAFLPQNASKCIWGGPWNGVKRGKEKRRREERTREPFAVSCHVSKTCIVKHKINLYMTSAIDVISVSSKCNDIAMPNACRCVLGNWDQLWVRAHLRLQPTAQWRSLWRQRRVCLRHQSSRYPAWSTTSTSWLHHSTSPVYWLFTTSVHETLAYVPRRTLPASAICSVKGKGRYGI